ncbi:hypothetical protein ZHAS_00002117 [Anopheles sinensis]|uniref:Fibrinogen C-terminal domain-containing protein n=1 Tax=Anopheles sinensis TaxID=74873 RepID=A0A084VBU0_ANOSI|nr:hypothetical protein ZHAS_00002117 [Anopheles sinensis]
MESLISKLEILQEKLIEIEQAQKACQSFHQKNLRPDEVKPPTNEENRTDKLDKIEQTIDFIVGKLDELTRLLQKDVKLQEKLDEVENKMKAVSDLVHKKLDEFEKSTKSLQEVVQCMKVTENTLITKLNNLEKMQGTKHKHLLDDNQLKILHQRTGFLQKYSELTPAKTITLKGPYKSSKDIPTKESGIYKIELNPGQNVSVYCEQVAFDGGWIVFQHRFNGKVKFNRYWSEYRDGFGSLDGEFWLGLEYLHQLTSAEKYELVIEMIDYEGMYRYARYDHFEIGSETEQYFVKNIGKYSGTAPDKLSFMKGKIFITKDRPNSYDRFGWWYYFECNLNGVYVNIVDSRSVMGWNGFRKYNQYWPLAFSRMMIRKVDECESSD